MTTNDDEIWSIPALKEYYDQRFVTIQLAVTKAEAATEKRFESVNEFRNTLADQQRTFMPRLENEVLFKNHENVHEQMNKKMDEIIKKMDKIENMKQGGAVIWSYVLGAVSLLAAMVGIALNVQKL